VSAPVAREKHGAVQGAALLAKGMTVLNAIGDSAAPPRLADLARLTGMPKATVHRIATALVEARMLRIDPRTQTYRLGYRLFELAHRVWQDFDLRGAAEPELQRLRDQAGETARLCVLDGEDVIVIDQHDAAQAVRLSEGVGGRFPAADSALGWAVLAFAGNEWLDRRGTDEALHRQLVLTKARGYAISERERGGLRAVAAPVIGRDGHAVAAIGLVGLPERLDAARLHSLGRDLMEAARRASGNAGASLISITPRPRPLRAEAAAVDCVLPAAAVLGESPWWSAAAARLHWVDILGLTVNAFDPATGTNVAVPTEVVIGSVVGRRAGGLIAATQRGIQALDPATGRMQPLADPESDRPGNRFNDGKCDRAGRLIAGTMSLESAPGRGSLYRIDADGRWTRLDEGFTVSNGVGFSPDGTRLYFSDSHSRRIWLYDYDPAAGTVRSRRVFAEIDQRRGLPDGLTVDAEGGVWVALWDGWQVIRLAPDGREDRAIALPVPRPTSCMFGGPGLDTLYVTSARLRLSAETLAEAPLSGGLLALRPGIQGLPEPAFAG